MVLPPGTRIGSYEVTAQIGAGGMGEVYRATDTNLKRRVAIKVLPEAVATDAERLARFRREAEVLAALNHPNIAAIYGLERADGHTALVLELVEGPTLADRLVQGPIPVDEALSIATQIAGALEAAHEQGIIHRDLKPANVKVRPDGTVKVLDFGLAKAIQPAVAMSTSSTMSPTITTPAMTRVGLILGTAAYMSPEQAKGRPADRRSDVWAFGALLFEMLAGRRAFVGDDVSDTMASVLKADTDWAALPASVPSRVVAVLKRCLQRDPKQRIADMQDVRLALGGAFDTDRGGSVGIATGQQPAWRRAMPWVAGAVLGGVVAAAVAWITLRPTAPPVQRYHLALDAGAPLYTSGNTADVAMSPDGQHIVYPGGSVGSELRVLSLSDGSSATLVAGGNPSMPFFSPDGTWVGFFDQPAQELRRVPARGGPVEVITRVGVQLRGATWGMDDTIVYASGVTNDLRRVPARGGTPEAVTVPDAGAPHVSPSFLPDGQALLFAIGQVPSDQQIAVLSLQTGTWDLLGLRGSSPQYVASGHLVYEAEGALRAVPFDAATRRVTGEPVAVETGVLTKITGAADYAVSRAGSLVFAPGAAERTRTLGWVDRDGDMTTTLMEAHTDVAYPRLSGDARRVAYLTGFPGDVWVRDLARGSDTRVTTDGTNAYAIWADGDSVAFTSNRDGLFKMYRQPVDLSGRAELLVETELTNVTGDWSSDGRTLVYYVITPDEGRDIWTLSLGESPRPLLATPFNERAPMLSPDGRWVAYVSDQSGTDQVHLMSFPDGGRVIPVSTTGGTEPAWSSDGRELFYRAGTQMWVVPVDLASGTPGQAALLFDAMYDLDQNSVGVANYDVSPDGRHFLMVRTASEGSPTVTLVENWLEDLRRLVPSD